ncbi:glutamate ABC transporter substrate-binding protein [Streptomyces bambusae]|uniref:Transporter substrate-binding domain-containing protein n=1 Tax=Streptomyces bambusae TaxID=1550616 RepID=A0ABS6ZG77_9ACTN|nr:glutamate ABC transporter substrate-binding protein [Streptomyces bambusae]MBW5486765.1 transporter substrate-binding domain-containing protein [Streptomyces bambusae]
MWIGDGARVPRGALAAAVAVAVCAVVAAAAVTLPHAPGGAAAPDRAAREPAARQAALAPPEYLADTCPDPEASLRPNGLDGDAVARIKKAGKLVAGVDQNSFRWGYRNPVDGRLEGFDIALVRAIAKDILGNENAVIFRAVPTSQRIPALQEGRVDIVVRTMTINCKRLEEVAFSTAYFEAGQQVLAPVAATEITGFDDSLKGRRVCTAAGSTGEAALRHEPHGSTPVTVPNQLDCLVRLQLGQVDAVVTDNALAAGQAAQDPSVRLVGKPFTREFYGVAMHKDASDLVRRVNQVLENYRAGGDGSEWMKAYAQYLRDDLPGVTAPPAPKYRDG